jgi:hypothetical protein
MSAADGGVGAPRSACAATRKDGTPCRSFVPPGRRFCFGHDPARQEAVRAARAAGGAAAARVRVLNGRRAKLDTPAQLLAFTAEVIHETLDGTLSADRARVVFYGLSIQRQLVETSDLGRHDHRQHHHRAHASHPRCGWLQSSARADRRLIQEHGLLP